MWPLILHPVPPPEVTITGATNSQVEYETTAHGNATRVIAGYEVTRFGVPMIGQYENTGRGSRVTISPAVPGAQYRITAWALGDGRRSATPAVVDATTGEAGTLCEIVGTDFLHLSHFLPRYIQYVTYCNCVCLCSHNIFPLLQQSLLQQDHSLSQEYSKMVLN